MRTASSVQDYRSAIKVLVRRFIRFHLQEIVDLYETIGIHK